MSGYYCQAQAAAMTLIETRVETEALLMIGTRGRVSAVDEEGIAVA